MESAEVISKVCNALYSYNKVISLEFLLSATVNSVMSLDTTLSVCGCVWVWLQRPSVTADTMFYESAQDSTPTRKGKMSDIPVNNTFNTFTGDVSQEKKKSFYQLSSITCAHVFVFARVLCVGGGRGFE